VSDHGRAALCFLKLLVLPSKPKPKLEAEIAALGQQVAVLQQNILLRHSPLGRPLLRRYHHRDRYSRSVELLIRAEVPSHLVAKPIDRDGYCR
jgi:hypothetical protein